MDSTRAAYDAVASAYADAYMDELEHRPLERGLLDEFVKSCEGRNGCVADLGCGPGHVARYLSNRGLEVLGLDLAPAMVEEARRRNPDLEFRVGSMTALDAPDCAWIGAVAFYSIIHLGDADRLAAMRQLARVIEPDGPLLLSFHVSTSEQACGTSVHLESWFDEPVDLTAYFLDPDLLADELQTVGFRIQARLEREPLSADEYPSRRCYLLARRLANRSTSPR